MSGLFVSVPAYCEIGVPTVRTLLSLTRVARSINVVEGVAAVDLARTLCLRGFLESDCDRMLFVDSDQSFELGLVERMLAADVDFVAVTSPQKRLPLNFAVMPLAGAEPRDGMIEVAAVGLACAMIRREVFVRMLDGYPNLVTEQGHGPALFLPLADRGRYVGEDVAFCRRWRAIGGRIYVLLDAPIAHHGRQVFEGAYAPVAAKLEIPEEAASAPLVNP